MVERIALRKGFGDILAEGSADFTVVGFGDFNGNATSDLLWRRESTGRYKAADLVTDAWAAFEAW